MSKHTPGPWYLRTNAHRNCDGTEWGWLDTQQAGSQRPPSGVSVGWSAGRESEANARLIAAAPDLLEALEMYSLPIDANNIALSCIEFGSEAVERELKRRAAIAKATGETK